MPLIVPGSMQIGPRPSGSSAPATLPEYLASIGKNSWYARFVAGTNMWTGATLNGSAASLNGNVGSWGVDSSNTSNFSAYWTQSTGGNQPYYRAANGINSLYAVENNPSGAAETRHLQLSSTTALNGDYTVIVRHPILARDSRTPYSHNATAFYWTTSTGSGQFLSGMGAGGSTSADQIIWVTRNTPGSSSGNCIIGISQTGTGHNNNAPYLLRRSTTYSSSAISEIWFTPQLTVTELDAAMTFIT